MLDFDGDLYGHRVSVGFTHHLRGQAVFAGVEELAAQMRADVDQARRLLSSPRVVQSGPAGSHARPPDRVPTRPGLAGAKGMVVLGIAWRWSTPSPGGVARERGTWPLCREWSIHDRAQAPQGAHPRPHGQDGESYTTARRHVLNALPPASYQLLGGVHPDTHAIAGVLANRGLLAPTPASRCRRPWCWAAGGGRGRLHPLGVQGPRLAALVLGFRNSWQYPDRWA